MSATSSAISGASSMYAGQGLKGVAQHSHPLLPRQLEHTARDRDAPPRRSDGHAHAPLPLPCGERTRPGIAPESGDYSGGSGLCENGCTKSAAASCSGSSARPARAIHSQAFPEESHTYSPTGPSDPGVYRAARPHRCRCASASAVGASCRDKLEVHACSIKNAA